MAEHPKGYISHRTNHRVRVRIPGKRHDRAFFADLHNRLSHTQGVQNVEVNPATASVLIHTSGPASQLLDAARQSGLLDIEDSLVGESTTILEHAGIKVDYLEQQIKQLSGGHLDLRNAAFLTLVAAALFQTVRGNVLHAPAATLLWYAARIMQSSRAVEGAR